MESYYNVDRGVCLTVVNEPFFPDRTVDSGVQLVRYKILLSKLKVQGHKLVLALLHFLCAFCSRLCDPHSSLSQSIFLIEAFDDTLEPFLNCLVLFYTLRFVPWSPFSYIH